MFLPCEGHPATLACTQYPISRGAHPLRSGACRAPAGPSRVVLPKQQSRQGPPIAASHFCGAFPLCEGHCSTGRGGDRIAAQAGQTWVGASSTLQHGQGANRVLSLASLLVTFRQCWLGLVLYCCIPARRPHVSPRMYLCNSKLVGSLPAIVMKLAVLG
jgi:hypothetical protein